MSVKRLCLGTAQFGSAYGIRPMGRPATKPSRPAVLEMLQAADAAGIPWVDTAAAYGDAEEQIGRWLKMPSTKGVHVSTKLLPHIADDVTGAAVTALVHRCLEQSLTRLGLNRVDAFLTHTPEYAFRNDVMAAMRSVRQAGLATSVGVSCYEPRQAMAAINAGMTCLQAPYNVFDQRFRKAFGVAKQRGATVFVRQPFLQSLLLMATEDVPPTLVHAVPLLAEFRAMCEAREATPAHVALQFSMRGAHIDHVVFGVEDRAQLAEDIEAVRSWPFIYRDAFELAFQDIPEAIVNPSRWAKG